MIIYTKNLLIFTIDLKLIFWGVQYKQINNRIVSVKGGFIMVKKALCGFIAGLFVLGSCFKAEAGVQGGTAWYSGYENLNFYAGDVYVKCEYGVKEDTAYVNMDANDVCDFSVDGYAYDWWGLEYRLYGGADQTTFFGVSCKNTVFDQMVRITASVRTDGPETGTTAYFDHDFRENFYE